MAGPVLILASASSARARLLREMGLSFRIVASGVEEADAPGESVEARTLRLARAKTEAVAARVGKGIVLGADSLVALVDEGMTFDGATRRGDSPESPGPAASGRVGRPAPPVLGKPRTSCEAAEMLRLQCGRETEVVTAVCVIDAATGRRAEGVERARVRLKDMTDDEIARYVSDPRVLTSAGGYLIEDERDPFVALVAGELGTVLGLPVALTRRLLGEIARVRRLPA